MAREPTLRLASTGPESASDTEYLAAIGQRVRLIRARRGMTRRLLCQQSGVSERYIAQLEAGRGNVSVLVLRDIAAGLGIEPVELLRDTPDEPLAQPGPDGARRNRIALIGLRGAGKSTLGRMLADQRGVAFHELDREIEHDAGMALAEMFELHGQAGFRRFERSALERLLAEPGGAVIAAGGGIVAEGGTYGLLLARCFTVWLRASPEEHMSRVVNQGDLRPMQDNRQAMADLKAILDSREQLYARADIELDTSGKKVGESFIELARMLVDNPRDRREA